MTNTGDITFHAVTLPHTANASAEYLFVGGAEMGAIMRAMDWSKTGLGSVYTGSCSLKNILGAIFGSHFHRSRRAAGNERNRQRSHRRTGLPHRLV